MDIKVSFVSLGCDKNLVDSEVMLGLLNKAGLQIISDEAQADVIIVNTCCFINDAKEESIENILEMADYKKKGNCKVLIVAGCMAERYKKEVLNEIPEVDGVVGTTSFEEIAQVISDTLKGEKVVKFEDINRMMEEERLRILSTPGYYGYLKIAEGCDNCCTYCIIPSLRGKYRSRTMDSLVKEAKDLVNQGVKELILVAQDTTRYGVDQYGKKMLPVLLEKLCEIENLDWIRLLYCYPEEISDELIEVIAKEPKICNYLDMPIQHANDFILKRMARKSTQGQLRKTIQKLREKVPDICLRTTLITGFPGETEAYFEDLLTFVQDMEFDRLGVFTYSEEEGTAAAKFPDQIEADTKVERKNQIMEIQKDISARKNAIMLGKVVKVLIDGQLPEEHIYCGRTYKDAPEIDGMVFVKSAEPLYTGDFVTVKITEVYEYDLIGEILDESCQ